MIQFGFRAHDFGKMSIENLAHTLQPFAPLPIQLALNKALENAPDTLNQLNTRFAQKIYSVLHASNIRIGVLGCYINPVHPDDDLLEQSLKRFERHLALSSDFGCSIVGTETGSCNADCSYHPLTREKKTFDRLCTALERLVRTAERYGAVVGVEAVARQHTIDSVEKMQQLLFRIDSPALRVIHDQVNLLPWEPFEDAQQVLFRKAFEAYGDKIVSIHLKDFRYLNGWKQGSLPPLSGDLDTKGLLTVVKQRKPTIDILLENCQRETAAQTIETLRFMERQL